MSEENKGFDFNKSLDEVKKDRNLGLTVGGLVVAFVSLFLPWYSFDFFTVSNSYSPGLSDDGLIIAILAVVGVGAALNVMNKEAKTMKTVAMVAALLALLVVISNYPDSEAAAVVSTGLGYWLALLSTIAAAFGSVMKFREGK